MEDRGLLPSRAQVVIIGGGVIGCSVAYHLAHAGWTDVLLLERNQLTSGTTWHAAGLVGQLRATHNMTRLAQYSAELYDGLEAETGHATGYLRRGSIMLASSDGRWDEVRRAHSTAKCFGLDSEGCGSMSGGRWLIPTACAARSGSPETAKSTPPT